MLSLLLPWELALILLSYNKNIIFLLVTYYTTLLKGFSFALVRTLNTEQNSGWFALVSPAITLTPVFFTNRLLIKLKNRTCIWIYILCISTSVLPSLITAFKHNLFSQIHCVVPKLFSFIFYMGYSTSLAIHSFHADDMLPFNLENAIIIYSFQQHYCMNIILFGIMSNQISFQM